MITRGGRVNPDTVLRRALLGNAVFSAASAGVMALGAPSLARLLGAVAPAALYVVAGALVLFALDLVHQVRAGRVDPLRALGATVGDLLWVGASGLLLLLWPELLTPEGEGRGRGRRGPAVRAHPCLGHSCLGTLVWGGSARARGKTAAHPLVRARPRPGRGRGDRGRGPRLEDPGALVVGRKAWVPNTSAAAA